MEKSRHINIGPHSNCTAEAEEGAWEHEPLRTEKSNNHPLTAQSKQGPLKHYCDMRSTEVGYSPRMDTTHAL
jgi:hypothetical protein